MIPIWGFCSVWDFNEATSVNVEQVSGICLQLRSAVWSGEPLENMCTCICVYTHGHICFRYAYTCVWCVYERERMGEGETESTLNARELWPHSLYSSTATFLKAKPGKWNPPLSRGMSNWERAVWWKGERASAEPSKDSHCSNGPYRITACLEHPLTGWKRSAIPGEGRRTLLKGQVWQLSLRWHFGL